MRLRLGFVLCAGTAAAAVVLALPGVALAKGPDQVTIESDRLDAPVVLGGQEGRGGDPMYRLVDQSGFFQATFGQVPDPMLDAAPTRNLGPELTLTWRVPGPSGEADTIRQLVYPYAEGGPLTFTPAGQAFFEADEARGGWYRAPAGLTATIETLTGLDPGSPAAPIDQPPPPSPPPPPTDWTRWLVGAAALAVSGVAAAGVAVSRRRVRVSAT
jgi:hypothetical protein